MAFKQYLDKNKISTSELPADFSLQSLRLPSLSDEEFINSFEKLIKIFDRDYNFSYFDLNALGADSIELANFIAFYDVFKSPPNELYSSLLFWANSKAFLDLLNKWQYWKTTNAPKWQAQGGGILEKTAKSRSSELVWLNDIDIIRALKLGNKKNVPVIPFSDIQNTYALKTALSSIDIKNQKTIQIILNLGLIGSKECHGHFYGILEIAFEDNLVHLLHTHPTKISTGRLMHIIESIETSILESFSGYTIDSRHMTTISDLSPHQSGIFCLKQLGIHHPLQILLEQEIPASFQSANIQEQRLNAEIIDKMTSTQAPELPFKAPLMPERINLSTLKVAISALADGLNHLTMHADELEVAKDPLNSITIEGLCTIDDLKKVYDHLPSRITSIELGFDQAVNEEEKLKFILTLSQRGLTQISINAALPKITEDWISEHHITCFIQTSQRNVAIENWIIEEKRKAHTNTLAVVSTAPQPDHLGPIGQSIYGKKIHVQSQMQQQQQQQQQQNVVDADDLPENTTIKPEEFNIYSGDDDLLNKNDFVESKELASILTLNGIKPKANETHLSLLWDQMLGDKPDFPYAIKQISKQAATVLLMHLDDCRYGFHPDNLPQGFSLVKDYKGDLSLIFDANTRPPKPTPLTPQLSSPKTARPIYGSFSGYLSVRNCQELAIDSESPISFKDIKDATKKANIIAGLFKPKIDTQVIEKLFLGCLNDKFFMAFLGTLDELGQDKLIALINDLNDLYHQKPDAIYQQFLTSFIHPSSNLSELCTEEAKDAIKKIKSFNGAQMDWWNSLLKNHSTPNINGQARWSNLSELCNGFTYFCEQLQDMHLDLQDAPCEFLLIRDMRIGLDRLLTILRNSLIPKENWGSSLIQLELDQFGLFYASRYEGFNHVSASMIDYAIESKQTSVPLLQGFIYRIPQNARSTEISGKRTASQASMNPYLKRVLASINQRALYSKYIEFIDYFESIKDELPCMSESGIEKKRLFTNLYQILVTFGTGLRGKHITVQEMQLLKTELSSLEKYSTDNLQTLNTLLEFNNVASRLNISGFFTIFHRFKYSNDEQFLLNRDLFGLINSYHTLASFGEQLLEILKILTSREDFNQVWAHFIQIFDLQGASLPTFSSAVEEDVFGKLMMVLALSIKDTTPHILTVYNDILSPDKFPDRERLLKILAVFSKIDPKTLAPQHDIIAFIQAIPASPQINDYASIIEHIQSELPNCLILQEEIDLSPISVQLSLNDILKKNKDEILAKVPSLAKEYFAELLDGANPEQDLISALKELPTGMIGDYAVVQISAFIMRFFDARSMQKISSLSKDETTKANLILIFSKLQPQALKANDMTAFLAAYTAAETTYQELFRILDALKRTWPSQFTTLVSQLNMVIDKHKHLTLAGVHTRLHHINGFFQGHELNLPLIERFMLSSNVAASIVTLTDDKVLSFPQKEAILSLSLKAENPYFATELYNYHQLPYFDALLNYLKSFENPELALTNFAKIKPWLEEFSPQSRKKLLHVLEFNAENGNDFLETLNIKKPNESLKAQILLLAFLKSEKNLNKLRQIQTLLDKLDASNLRKLLSIYQGPNGPNIDELIDSLRRTLFAADDLIQTYDIDPHGEKGDEIYLKNAAFEPVYSYLDEMQDLYHKHPLLLSERRELAKQLSYIQNIIYRYPIDVVNGQAKKVDELSRTEIKDLITKYQTALANRDLDKERQLALKLRLIALLSEAMYRCNHAPRMTQILYMLRGLQSDGKFVGQLNTGEGKSMIVALQSAFLQLQGKTVDVCTSTPSLASADLAKYQSFFDYLDIPTALIRDSSKSSEYKEGQIHYSSLSNIALFRSKAELSGKVFPKDGVLVADEIDFSTLDDTTTYRYATLLDEVEDPYTSPFVAIYQRVVDYVDKLEATEKSDVDLLRELKETLASAIFTSKLKQQLKALDANPEVYNARLSEWLIAAAESKKLLAKEGSEFMVATLPHPEQADKEITKACLKTYGLVNISAEYANSVQQFLHLRLKHKYQEKINDNQMPDFLIAPEKVSVASLNSNIMLSRYPDIYGLTGTAGSAEEIREQHAKFGFEFTRIPPFQVSKLEELSPLLTRQQRSFSLGNRAPFDEVETHIQLIVDDIKNQIKAQKTPPLKPILIHVKDKEIGEKLTTALQGIKDSPYAVNQHYSQAQSQEAQDQANDTAIHRAGQVNQITISDILKRGSDIVPPKNSHLYTIKTFVDGDEDILRALKQEFGRAGRAGQKGEARLILRRSEFQEIMNPDDLGTSKEAVHAAIDKLNELRYRERLEARVLREQVDELKHIIQYSGFQQIIGILRDAGIDANDIFVTSRDFMAAFDEEFGKLQLIHQEKVNHMITWMSDKWQIDFPKVADAFSKIELSPFETLSQETIVAYMTHRFPKKPEAPRARIEKGLPTPEIDAFAYYDELSTEDIDKSELKKEDLNRFMQKYLDILDRQPLSPTLKAEKKDLGPAALNLNKKVAFIVKGLSYLKYYYPVKDNDIDLFVNKIKVYGDQSLITTMIAAHQTCFNTLTLDFGKDAPRKTKFLLSSEARWHQLLPEDMKKIKTESFQIWWTTQEPKFSQNLKKYANPIFSRVSEDRKNLVQMIIDVINKPEELLSIIAAGKLQLLKDDSIHQRPLSSTLDDQLFKMLLEMEERLMLATPANKLDEVIDKQFLFFYMLCQQLIPGTLDMLKMFNDTFDTTDLQTQYDACQLIMLQMQNIPETNPLLQLKDWKTFKTFCQTESHRLATLIHLCDKHKSLSKTGSVYQYRAASRLATDIQQIGKAAVHSELFSYQAKQFAIAEIDDSTLVQQPWIKDINTAENYQRLFANLEEHLIRDNPDLKGIFFESPELAQAMDNPNKFFLTINAQLDDKKVQFKYVFDLQQKKVLLYNIKPNVLASQTQFIAVVEEGVGGMIKKYQLTERFFSAAKVDGFEPATNEDLGPKTPK